MAGDVIFKVDTTEFKKVMREMAKTTSQEGARFLNDQARRLALTCLEKTPKVDAKQIRKELLGPAHHSVKSGGRTKSRRVDHAKDTLGARLVISWRRKANLPSISGKELTAAVRKLVAQRQRGIGYMKAGWIPVIQKFSAAMGIAPRTSRVPTFGKALGQGVTAKPRHLSDMKATLINEAVQDMTANSAKPGKAFKIGKQVMESALAARLADMKQHIQDKMNGIARKYTAR